MLKSLQLGLWHWQRWVIGLWTCYGLRPVFLPLPPDCRTKGIGGAATPLAVCDMPMGLAGTNGVMRWLVLEEPDGVIGTPPLVPNGLFIHLDAVIEPKQKRVTFRVFQRACDITNVLHPVNGVPTVHQPMPMTTFEPTGWEPPEGDHCK